MGKYLVPASRAMALCTTVLGCALLSAQHRPLVAPLMATIASGGGPQGNTGGFAPRISSDGRFVAYQSLSTNLVQGDTNGCQDIFVHDVRDRTTRRVSVSSTGTQANAASASPGISANGRYVAYASSATNLVDGDTNDQQDIFVYDLFTHKTTRVSVASDGTQADRYSTIEVPSVSADGRFIAFTSIARNLVPNDTNFKADVFVHDQITKQTSRVSVASNGAEGNGDSQYQSISGDGRYVAFLSYARNLAANDTNFSYDVFRHDRLTGVTELVSVNLAGFSTQGGATGPSISGDGQKVGFYATGSGFVQGNPSPWTHCYVRNLATGMTYLISVPLTGSDANEDSFHASFSYDGNLVAFSSRATNLIHGDTNNRMDVFVRNMLLGSTVLASASRSGVIGNGESHSANISSGGLHVTFYSEASNLVVPDIGGIGDIFVTGPSRAWLTP